MTENTRTNRIILTVLGMDMVGIIARVATELAACRANIIDISQTIMQELFVMMMVVDLSGACESLEAIQARMKKAGEDLGVQITVQHEDVFRYMHRI